MNEMLTLLSHSRQVVRKKSIGTLGSLAPFAFDDIFINLTKSLIQQMQQTANDSDFEKLATYLHCFATISKVSSDRMVSIMQQLIESTIQYCKLDDDDLREQCLQSLEVFVQNSITVDECLNTIIDLSVEYLSYDPNYIDNSEDSEMSDEDEEYFLVVEFNC